MKRPVMLIVGAVAGALLVAAVGASAHTGLFAAKFAGVQSAVSGDEATGTRTEPVETPEAAAEPTETPEPADTDTDTDETETNDDSGHTAGATTTTKETGDHESGSTTARKDD